VIAGGFASPESAELITIVDSVEKVFDVLSDVSVSKTETASERL